MRLFRGRTPSALHDRLMAMEDFITKEKQDIQDAAKFAIEGRTNTISALADEVRQLQDIRTRVVRP